MDTVVVTQDRVTVVSAGVMGPPGTPNVLLAGRLLVVDAVNGNDSSGTRGRLDRAYLTLAAAQAAASSGDTIIVYPGTYAVTTNLNVSGIKWLLIPGVTMNVTGGGVVPPASQTINLGSIFDVNGPLAIDADGVSIGDGGLTVDGGLSAEEYPFSLTDGGGAVIGGDGDGNATVDSTAVVNLGISANTINIGTGSNVSVNGGLIQTTNDSLAFFGATPIARTSVTGSRGGNAALASLLTNLALLGLITDSTTA